MPDKDENLAILMLPRGVFAQVADSTAARWISRGDLGPASADEVLTQIASLLGTTADGLGRAALRYWGETTHRPNGWVVAADPVHLEARLDHLRLHALRESEVAEDLVELVAALNSALGNDGDDGRFVAHDGHGYLLADDEFCTSASRSPADIDGAEPSGFMPEGRDSAGYQRLQSEIQMVLHESPVRERRESAGHPPINGLWLWGGGFAPQSAAGDLPLLYGEEPLLSGFWRCSGVATHALPESLSDCMAGDRRFVAVLPEDQRLSMYLEEARDLLAAGAINRLILVFEDGVEVSLRPSHRYRFWRGVDALRVAGEAHE